MHQSEGSAPTRINIDLGLDSWTILARSRLWLPYPPMRALESEGGTHQTKESTLFTPDHPVRIRGSTSVYRSFLKTIQPTNTIPG